MPLTVSELHISTYCATHSEWKSYRSTYCATHSKWATYRESTVSHLLCLHSRAHLLCLHRKSLTVFTQWGPLTVPLTVSEWHISTYCEWHSEWESHRSTHCATHSESPTHCESTVSHSLCLHSGAHSLCLHSKSLTVFTQWGPLTVPLTVSASLLR